MPQLKSESSCDSQQRVPRERVLALVVSALFLLLCFLFYFTNGFGFLDVHAKKSLDQYSWPELRAISEKIADAETEAEAVEIEIRYNLVDEDGHLNPHNLKSIQTTNGEQGFVRIIGFRHDEKADGNGRAGITFCFISPICKKDALFSSNGRLHAVPSDDLRTWLNTELIGSMPYELRSNVQSAVVRSASISYGNVTYSEAAEKMWLLSLSEYAGQGIQDAGEQNQGVQLFNVGDEQYQFFREQGITWTNAIKLVESAGEDAFWLRTPAIYDDNDVVLVASSHAIEASKPDAQWGIMPVFCL